MSAVISRPAIKYLSPQIADQIAAGEVIERPSSVLKEIIENALDANASRIDIDLAGGGAERIRVTDNGDGIVGDELILAVSRHATSKLDTIQDLQSLLTLGFRGEALASICSVSQWQLVSCVDSDVSAWRLGSAAPTQILPDHHPRGTTIQIDRLFYNTPARKKFLRAERTEFRHCDDVIRRMALARFDVGFFVKHNARQVHRLPAVRDDTGRTRRVAQICGEQFIKESLALDFSHEGMRVWGWVSTPAYTRQQTDLQYFYLNGRVIRDRMINHAIRFAYQDILPIGRQPAYVLHFEIEPDRFDVNVHPTKQEVRFRETRMVHDFLTRSLRQALHSGGKQQDPSAFGMHHPAGHYPYETYHQEVRDVAEPYTAAPRADGGILFERYLFRQRSDTAMLLDVRCVHARWTVERWQLQLQTGRVKQQPLLIPLRFKISPQQFTQLETKQASFKQLGFDIAPISSDEVILRFIPVVLSDYRSMQDIVFAILEQSGSDVMPDGLHDLLARMAMDTNSEMLSRLMSAVDAQPDLYRVCWCEMTEAELAGLLRRMY